MNATTRTAACRLERPSASGKPIRHAAPSDAQVSPMARSAPLQYGPEESASQNRWVSKLASTLPTSLLHVTQRNLLLLCKLLKRPVLLELLDGVPECLSQLCVRR